MDQTIPSRRLDRRAELAAGLTITAGAAILFACGGEQPDRAAEPIAGQQVEAPRTPSPEQEAIRQLTARAQELASPAAKDGEQFDALFAAAGKLGTDGPGMAEAFRDLLVMLGYATAWRRMYGTVHDEAAQLIAWHERLSSDHPELMNAEACRYWADASLMANDLRGLDRAIRRGMQILGDDPIALSAAQHHERAQLSALAVRLNCMLGRLEIAAEHSGAAIESAEIYRQSVAALAADDPVREQAAAVAHSGLVHAHMAAADLHLMAGNYAKAAHHVETAGGSAAWQQFCQHLVAALAGDVETESDLADDCVDPELPADLVTFGTRKLIQLALDRGDVPAAKQRLSMWRRRGAVDIGVHQGLDAMLEMEIALRQPRERTVELLASARASFDRLLAQWQKAPDLAGGIGFLHMTERSTLTANLLRLESAMDPGEGGATAGLALVLQAHAATCPGPAPDLAAVRRELLGEHHAALIYVPGRFASVLLMLTRDAIAAYELSSDEVLRTTIDALRGAAELARLGSPGASETLRTAVRTATDALLPAAVVAWLSTCRRLTVVGSSMLNNAPFGLLRPDAGAGTSVSPYLGQSHGIVYVPNLAFAMTQPAARRDGTTLIAGSLRSTGTGRQAYGFPRAYLDACRAPYERHEIRPRLLIDDQVSKTTLRQSLPGARIVNLIGHGKSEWHRLYENGLLFGNGPDDALWGEDVLDLELTGATVMLSACAAGNAPWRRGGDPLAASLAGALMSVGARCVLVPTSNVRLEPHMRAMASIHEQLAGGQPLAEALRTAQQDGALDEPALVELLLLQVHGLGF